MMTLKINFPLFPQNAAFFFLHLKSPPSTPRTNIRAHNSGRVLWCLPSVNILPGLKAFSRTLSG